jgi:hypothetical protein
MIPLSQIHRSKIFWFLGSDPRKHLFVCGIGKDASSVLRKSTHIRREPSGLGTMRI